MGRHLDRARALDVAVLGGLAEFEWLLSKTAQLRREPAGRVDKIHYFGPVTVAWVASDCADERIYRHLRQGVLCPLPRPAAP